MHGGDNAAEVAEIVGTLAVGNVATAPRLEQVLEYMREGVELASAVALYSERDDLKMPIACQADAARATSAVLMSVMQEFLSPSSVKHDPESVPLPNALGCLYRVYVSKQNVKMSFQTGTFLLWI